MLDRLAKPEADDVNRTVKRALKRYEVLIRYAGAGEAIGMVLY